MGSARSILRSALRSADREDYSLFVPLPFHVHPAHPRPPPRLRQRCEGRRGGGGGAALEGLREAWEEGAAGARGGIAVVILHYYRRNYASNSATISPPESRRKILFANVSVIPPAPALPPTRAPASHSSPNQTRRDSSGESRHRLLQSNSENKRASHGYRGGMALLSRMDVTVTCSSSLSQCTSTQ